MFRAKRRTAVTVTAGAAVLLAAALAVTLLTRGSSANSGRVVTGNTVEYTSHRPLAPDFTAQSLTGATVTMASYRGKTVVLNFWGSWCPPCRAEAPVLEVASQQYSSQGVAFLGDDVYDSPASALAFIHADHVTYPSINDPGSSVIALFSRAAPISATPTTVVIDKTGHIAGMVLGQVSAGQLASLLRVAGVAA